MGRHAIMKVFDAQKGWKAEDIFVDRVKYFGEIKGKDFSLKITNFATPCSATFCL